MAAEVVWEGEWDGVKYRIVRSEGGRLICEHHYFKDAVGTEVWREDGYGTGPNARQAIEQRIKRQAWEAFLDGLRK